MKQTEPRPPGAVAGTADEPTDGELLRRVVTGRDEASFAALVRRHGPLVLSVCRRVLRQEQDAEDAFQATFLVLFRKAGSVSKRESVGSWLYSVAYRTAQKAKAKRARRQVQPSDLSDVPTPEGSPAWLEQEVRAVLDDEVNRLPAKYRLPFVFCCFEGKTNEQAAQLLGCAVGTVQSRLSRARERLRGRLTRRGLAIPAGLIAVVLAEQAACAEVPATLIEATLQSTVVFGAGRVAASTTSPRVANLARQVLWDQRLAQLTRVGVGLLGLAVVGLVLVLALRPKPDQERIQGTWQVTEWWTGPAQIPMMLGSQFVFDGEHCTHQGPNFSFPTTFQLDPAKDPKEIDITMDANGALIRGIYRFEGDRLVMVLNLQGLERPTDFNKGANPWWSYFETRRE